MADKQKRKEELKELARKVIDMLRPEELPMWQVREVLRYAANQLEDEELKER